MRPSEGRAALAPQESERRSPRIRVAALVVIDGDVVTVRHRKGDATYHLLPGGGVDWGESLEDALRREMAEETGLEIGSLRLLFVSDTIAPDGSRHVVNVTFAAEVTGGTLLEHAEDPRVEAVDLVSPAALTTLDLRPPIATEIVAALSQGDFSARYLGSRYSEGP